VMGGGAKAEGMKKGEQPVCCPPWCALNGAGNGIRKLPFKSMLNNNYGKLSSFFHLKSPVKSTTIYLNISCLVKAR